MAKYKYFNDAVFNKMLKEYIQVKCKAWEDVEYKLSKVYYEDIVVNAFFKSKYLFDHNELNQASDILVAVIDKFNNTEYFALNQAKYSLGFYGLFFSLALEVFSSNNEVEFALTAYKYYLCYYNRIKTDYQWLKINGLDCSILDNILLDEVSKKDKIRESYIHYLSDYIEKKIQYEKYAKIELLTLTYDLYKETNCRYVCNLLDSIYSDIRQSGFDIVSNGFTDARAKNGYVVYRNGPSIVFKSEALVILEENDIYLQTLLFLKLAVLILQIHDVYPAEYNLIDNFISAQNLSISNKNHLCGLFRFFLLKKHQLRWFLQETSVNYTLLTLNKQQRDYYAMWLLRLSLVSTGNISQERLVVLKKILPVLNNEYADIGCEIRRLLFDKDVMKVSLSKEKLNITELQTTDSHKILSDVFKDEEQTNEVEIGIINDNVHLSLLKELFAKEVWHRNEVEALCKKYNVLIGKALEDINNYAYEIVDDVVIEDEGNRIFVYLKYKDDLL